MTKRPADQDGPISVKKPRADYMAPALAPPYIGHETPGCQHRDDVELPAADHMTQFRIEDVFVDRDTGTTWHWFQHELGWGWWWADNLGWWDEQ
jgi:hypothetical protein